MVSKDKGGRPPLFDTPEALHVAAEDYFSVCDEDSRPYTVAGLCYHLGFSDRDSFADQARRDGFSRTVKKIRLRIEAKKNEMLVAGEGNTAGVIFDLKNNHGWRDKKEVEHSGSIDSDYLREVQKNLK